MLWVLIIIFKVLTVLDDLAQEYIFLFPQQINGKVTSFGVSRASRLLNLITYIVFYSISEMSYLTIPIQIQQIGRRGEFKLNFWVNYTNTGSIFSSNVSILNPVIACYFNTSIFWELSRSVESQTHPRPTTVFPRK